MTLATRWKMVIGFGLATTLLGVIAVLVYLSTARLVADAKKVARTLEVLAKLEETLSMVLDAESDERGYLLTGDGGFLPEFASSIAKAVQMGDELGKLVGDSREQAARARRLGPLIADRFSLMRQSIAMRESLGANAVRVDVLSGEGRVRMSQVRALIDEMRTFERRLLNERVLEFKRGTQVATGFYAMLVLLVLVLLGSVYHLVRRDLAERARVEDELRVSRERYAIAVRGSRDGLWDWDVVSGQCYFSPRWKRMLGYEEDEIGDNYAQFAELLHPDDRERAESTIAAYLVGIADEYEQEIRLRHKDGSYRWILTRGAAHRDQEGRSNRMAGSHTDITARKVAEDRLSEQNLRLEEAVDSERDAHEELKLAQSRLVQSEKLAGLGQTVAGVAHEINNPLAFVINNVAVLERDIADLRELAALHEEATPILAREAPDLLARIEAFRDQVDIAYTLENLPGLIRRSRDGLTRIEQVVKDLRLFARLDENELKEADLNDGIRTTITIIRGNARREDVQLETDLKPLPLVACQPAKINQVVMNLLSNAIDACDQGGSVTVRSWHELDAVRIAISDTGPGIDPAIRDRIFDPFFTTKPVGKGTGLGLSISYGIIKEHGGSITVDSALGRGTTFIVRIPLRASVPAAHCEAEPGTPLSA